MASLASLAIGIAISAVFLWLAVRNVEWSRLWDQIEHVRVMPLLAGFAAALAGLVAMAYRWHVLVGPSARVSVADTYDFTTIGFLAGLVIPQRLGDIVKVVLLARRGRVSRTTVLGTVLLERLTDMVMLLSLAAIFAATIRLPILLEASLVVVAAVTAGVLIALCFRRVLITRVSGVARRFLPARPVSFIEVQIAKLADGFHTLQSGTQFLSALALAALIWLLAGLSMSAYVQAFDLAVPWYAGFLVILLTNLGGILPSSPGSIGVYHYMTVVALSTWSTDRTAALTFALVTHALTMLLIVTTGFWGLARQGLSLRTIRKGYL